MNRPLSDFPEILNKCSLMCIQCDTVVIPALTLLCINVHLSLYIYHNIGRATVKSIVSYFPNNSTLDHLQLLNAPNICSIKNTQMLKILNSLKIKCFKFRSIHIFKQNIIDIYFSPKITISSLIKRRYHHIINILQKGSDFKFNSQLRCSNQ